MYLKHETYSKIHFPFLLRLRGAIISLMKMRHGRNRHLFSEEADGWKMGWRGREGGRGCNRTPLGGQLLLRRRRAAVVAETEFRQFTTATQTPLQRRLLTAMLRPHLNLCIY